MDISLTPQLAVVLAVVMGLTSLSKQYIDSKWAALISVALGVAGTFLVPQATLQATILTGLVVGLTGAGLYSGTKSTLS